MLTFAIMFRIIIFSAHKLFFREKEWRELLNGDPKFRTFRLDETLDNFVTIRLICKNILIESQVPFMSGIVLATQDNPHPFGTGFTSFVLLKVTCSPRISPVESGTFRPQTISPPSRFAPKTFPPWSFPP